MSYVITVEILVQPGRMKEFMPLILANGRDSAAKEPGCRRFDVLVPRDRADTVFLYEIYDNEAAFDAHRQTPHYNAFKQASKDLIKQLTVQRYDVAKA